MFKDFVKYNVEDFLLDTSFGQFVKDTDAQASLFWKRFQQEHPEKQEAFALAVNILKGLQFRDTIVDTVDKERIWNDVIKEKNVEEKSKLAFLAKMAHWRKVDTGK
ncbi:hypothetical protein ACI6Q2_12380 [Chitinophagaceae bacterium LWZ2-11]